MFANVRKNSKSPLRGIQGHGENDLRKKLEAENLVSDSPLRSKPILPCALKFLRRCSAIFLIPGCGGTGDPNQYQYLEIAMDWCRIGVNYIKL
jgi:hypothetical protein